MSPRFHQTLHFFLGFIGEPKGQLKALENSGKFLSVPFTLKSKQKQWSDNKNEEKKTDTHAGAARSLVIGEWKREYHYTLMNSGRDK